MNHTTTDKGRAIQALPFFITLTRPFPHSMDNYTTRHLKGS